MEELSFPNQIYKNEIYNIRIELEICLLDCIVWEAMKCSGF